MSEDEASSDGGSSWSSWTDYNSFSEAFLVTVGVVLSVLASLLTCVGLALQKVSLCTPGNEGVDAWKQPKWVIGFVAMLVGNIVDFIAFGMASASLLAPLAALSLVWNLFVSSYVLNEKFDRTDVLAVGLIFLGTAITVIFANHHEESYPLEKLRALYRMPRMYAYFFFVPLSLAMHYGLIYLVQERRLTGSGWKLAELVGWAGFAGITGGQSVLFAKSTVELLKDGIKGEDVFLHLDTYVIIAAMVTCLLTQISFLNGAMLRFDQLYVLPVYQSYWILSGVIGGLVYFGEFEDLSTGQINMFLVGTMITFSGLYVLTQKENHSINSPTNFDVLPNRRISMDSYPFEDDDDEFAIEDMHDGIELQSPKLVKARNSAGSSSSIDSAIGADDSDTRRRSGSHTLAFDM